MILHFSVSKKPLAAKRTAKCAGFVVRQDGYKRRTYSQKVKEEVWQHRCATIVIRGTMLVRLRLLTLEN